MVGNRMKAIILSAFSGLFYVVIWSDAVEVSKYTIKTLTCDVTYGHVIATTRAFSAIHCSIDCENRVGCVSSVLDVNTGDCYLNNSTTLSCHMVQGKCGKELKYIEKLAESLSCVSTTDCKENDSPVCKIDEDRKYCQSCRSGRCSCKPLYYLHAIENTCYLNCTTLDDTFEYIYENPKAFFNARGNVSLTECRELCLCESKFTCNWFAYDADSATCTFTDDLNRDVHSADVSAKFYKRICAYP